MNVGIFAVDDVLDDGMARRFAEAVPINAAANMTERIERREMGHDDAVAIHQSKPRPSGFGQRGLIVPDQVARRMIQRGDDLSLVLAQQDSRVREKSLGSADLTLLVHKHDGFVLGIEAEAASANAAHRRSLARTRRSVLSIIHASSTL